jgi:hypothetical protein
MVSDAHRVWFILLPYLHPKWAFQQGSVIGPSDREAQENEEPYFYPSLTTSPVVQNDPN